MSDTPRTDKEYGAWGVRRDFALQLERELNQWRDCATKLHEILSSYPCYAPDRLKNPAMQLFNELNK